MAIEQAELIAMYDRLATDKPHFRRRCDTVLGAALALAIESRGPSPEYQDWVKRSAAIGFAEPIGRDCELQYLEPQVVTATKEVEVAFGIQLL